MRNIFKDPTDKDIKIALIIFGIVSAINIGLQIILLVLKLK